MTLDEAKDFMSQHLQAAIEQRLESVKTSEFAKALMLDDWNQQQIIAAGNAAVYALSPKLKP